jgi:hypothetical protein
MPHAAGGALGPARILCEAHDETMTGRGESGMRTAKRALESVESRALSTLRDAPSRGPDVAASGSSPVDGAGTKDIAKGPASPPRRTERA